MTPRVFRSPSGCCLTEAVGLIQRVKWGSSLRSSLCLSSFEVSRAVECQTTSAVCVCVFSRMTLKGWGGGWGGIGLSDTEHSKTPLCIHVSQETKTTLLSPSLILSLSFSLSLHLSPLPCLWHIPVSFVIQIPRLNSAMEQRRRNKAKSKSKGKSAILLFAVQELAGNEVKRLLSSSSLHISLLFFFSFLWHLILPLLAAHRLFMTFNFLINA